MASAPITHLSTFTRSRETWPLAKAKARKRKRERKTIARLAQAARDKAQDNPNR